MEIVSVLKYTWFTEPATMIIDLVWASLPPEIARTIEANTRKVLVTVAVMALLVWKLLLVSGGVFKVLVASAGVLLLLGAKLLIITAGVAVILGASLPLLLDAD